MILGAHGISVDVPRGWDARIFRRVESDVSAPAAPDSDAVAVPLSGLTTPVLHLASFALPEGRGDYGSGAVGRMRSSDVFVALVEFGPESAGTALFGSAGMPRFRSADVSESIMQRPVAGMAGAQRFFTAAGRPFCAYAVVGSFTRRSSLVSVINGALERVTISSV